VKGAKGTSESLPWNRVTDLLRAAFEGGSNRWCKITRSHSPSKFVRRADNKKVHPHLDYPTNPGGSLTIAVEKMEGKTYTLDIAAIERGVEALKHSEKYAYHWRDIENKNDGGISGDVFLQFCLFGDVKFG
jgi:hypothetical protein